MDSWEEGGEYWAMGKGVSEGRRKEFVCATPWTVALQAPLSMEFLRQGYWSQLPFPPPGDLPNPGIESLSPSPASAASAGRFFTTKAPGEPAE